MNGSLKKILCILLISAVFLCLFSACITSEIPADGEEISGQNEPSDGTSDQTDPYEEDPADPSVNDTEEETLLPDGETQSGVEDDTNGNVPSEPDAEVGEPVPNEEPTEVDTPPVDAVPAEGEAEEVKELPRDKYGLPLPSATLPEESLSLCLAQTEEVGYDYFTDAVFLGDSVTLGLKNYTTKKRKNDENFLSNASFIGVGSYGVYEALKTPTESTIHALYNGVQTQPQDILAATGAKTVFICLGLNDVGLFSKQDHLMHYATLILRIQTACPGIKIVVLSTTPLTVEGEKKHLYNQKIDEYNRSVIELAKQYNCYYADIASVLKDGEGYLTYELSSDNYCHLEDEAYDMIIEYLRTHATPDAVSSESEVRETVIEPAAEVEGYEGEMGEW